jgi:hypothetical protein
VPVGGQTFTLVGYGVAALDSGIFGERREGEAQSNAFDRETGVLEVSGAAACFGDSGGPLLYGVSDAVVGVIGQVGGSTDASFCDIGLSFASTVANERVRAFLEEACASIGGCGSSDVRDARADTVATDAGDASIPVEPDGASPDGDIRDASVDRWSSDGSIVARGSASSAGCGCVVSRGSGVGARFMGLALILGVLGGRRTGRSRRLGSWLYPTHVE